MTVDESETNNSTGNLTEYEEYYRDWKAGKYNLYCIRVRKGIFIMINVEILNQRECIPVGCVLPAAIAVWWVVSSSVHAGIPKPPPPV